VTEISDNMCASRPHIRLSFYYYFSTSSK